MLDENETLTVNGDQGIADKETRAILREGFLRAVTELNDKTCSLLTYEQSTLKAIFIAWKPDGSDILVRDLQTPAGIKIPAALLRTPDILAINFDDTVH
nr:uncharacterized protein LOC128673586 [Plodia interpunctella]